MASVDELWLETLQRLCEATAHDLRGALNGAALNVEVLRSRSGRPGEASALSPFAESAAAELESVIASTEAMLGLARPPRGPADIGRVVREVAALLGRPAATRGRRLAIDASVQRIGATEAPATVVRLVVGAALLSATGGEADVECSTGPEAPGPVLRISRSGRDGSSFALDERIVSSARDAAVHFDTTASGATITFPRNPANG